MSPTTTRIFAVPVTSLPTPVCLSVTIALVGLITAVECDDESTVHKYVYGDNPPDGVKVTTPSTVVLPLDVKEAGDIETDSVGTSL